MYIIRTNWNKWREIKCEGVTNPILGNHSEVKVDFKMKSKTSRGYYIRTQPTPHEPN